MRYFLCILWMTAGMYGLVLGDELSEKDSLMHIWQNPSAPGHQRLAAMDLLIEKYFNGRQPDSAKYYAQQLLDLALQEKDTLFQAKGLVLLASAASQLKMVGDVKSYALAALPLWQVLNDTIGLARTYNQLGISYKGFGLLDSALIYMEKSLSLYEMMGDSSSTIAPYLNMAAIFEGQGNVLRSMEYNEIGIARAKQYGKTQNEAIGRNNLANNYKFVGRIEEAAEQYFLSRAIYEAEGSDWGVLSSLNNLAVMYLDDQEYGKMKQYLDEALDIARNSEQHQGLAMTYANLGTMYQYQSQFRPAIEAFEQSLSIIQEQGIVPMESYVQIELGGTYLSLREFAQAESYLTKGLSNGKVNGRVQDVINGFLYMSKLSAEQGEWTQAKSYAQDGFDLASRLQAPGLKANFAEQLVRIYKQEGNSREALRMYEIEVAMRDSVFNEENTRALINQEYQYTYEKQALQDSLQYAADLQVAAADVKRRTTTNWLLGSMLLLVLIFGLILFNRFRITQQQKQIIEREKTKLDQANGQLNQANLDLNLANEKLTELDAFKSRFFTNISHEFRTPLTVIGGMTDQVISQPEQWAKKGGSIIKRNVQSLLSLINQILDLRKLESGSLSLSLIQSDVVKFLRLEVAAFESMAESKGVALSFESEVDSILMDFDPDKLGQIQKNLLSNAIKFTPAGGTVYTKVDKNPVDHLSLRVIDSGIGIPPEKLPLIFDRFYQVDSSDTREGEGTGIGLSLTKELVHLMQGDISVESEVGKGTVFHLRFPIHQQAPFQAAPVVQSLLPTISLPLKTLSPSLPHHNEKPSLLIIEDNPDIVEYLHASLEDQYDLFSAPNGEVGIEAALEQVPDLIITDVMMPRKNGYEVCETLKLDMRTSHIPIVMLTAKADADSRIEGYQRGADAYLPKPFDQRELEVRLNKLLELRQKLRQRYQSVEPAETSKDPAIQIEDAFITKARQRILAKLDDSTYRGESLAGDLAMSRVSLHRKLKALTGQSTTHFINSVKVEHAKDLLQDPQLQIAEVAYMVGFSDPAYFTRTFTKIEGRSPGEWREA